MNTPELVAEMESSKTLLGEVVTWDMKALEVPLGTVVQALETADLPTEIAGEMKIRTAFGRACAAFRKDRTIDKVDADGDMIRFQFTTKHLESSRLTFDYECVVELDLSDGSIYCEESDEIQAHARELFDHSLTHRTTTDITRMVQRMFVNYADLFAINPRK